jgi:SAM-dependent methyltransferase
VPSADEHHWEDWYAGQDHRRMPWYSPRPSPWLVHAVRSRTFPRGCTVLDIGCGTGSNVIWLGRRGFDAAGIDISPTAIAVASERARRARVSLDLRVASATALPFRDGCFRAALDSGCFHSLPLRARAAYAGEVARVLRPGAPFLLTWVPREALDPVGPAHRPSLAETAAVFEPGFVFARVESHGSGSPGGWKVKGTRLGRSTALLVRRRDAQPPPR